MEKTIGEVLRYSRKVFPALIFGIFFIFQSSYGEVKINLREQLRFKEMRVGSGYDGMIIAEGIIEILADEEDFGKGVKFDIPEFAFMSNRKNWVKVGKIVFDREIDKIQITQKKQFMRIYGILDRDEVEKNGRREILEGNYEGGFPIVYSVYLKKQ